MEERKCSVCGARPAGPCRTRLTKAQQEANRRWDEAMRAMTMGNMVPAGHPPHLELPVRICEECRAAEEVLQS